MKTISYLRCRHCLERMVLWNIGLPNDSYWQHCLNGQFRFIAKGPHVDSDWGTLSMSELTLFPNSTIDYCNGIFSIGVAAPHTLSLYTYESLQSVEDSVSYE